MSRLTRQGTPLDGRDVHSRRAGVPSASERKTLFFTSFGIELTLGSVSVITDPSRQPRCPRIGSVMRRPFAGPRGSSAPC